MPSKPATMQDVAYASGVSTATVSYVVNNGPRRVDPETRERVLAAMERLRYHPNTMARGLLRKRLNSLGVVFPQPYPGLVADSYFGSILDGITRVATERRQDVMLYTSLDYNCQKNFKTFQDRRVDGLLLIATLTDSGIVPALQQVGVPFVMINASSIDESVMTVDINNHDAARQVIEHFAQLGHHRIALLGGQPNSPSTSPRRAGFLKAMHAHGLAVNPDYMLEGTYTEDWGLEGMQRLLALPEPPTAVFAGGDGIAVGASKACLAAGFSVPGDVSIVGFDDAPYASTAQPPLTTMRHPLPEIGAAAATLLLEHLDASPAGSSEPDPAARKQLVMSAQLIVRQSTGPAGPAGAADEPRGQQNEQPTPSRRPAAGQSPLVGDKLGTTSR